MTAKPDEIKCVFLDIGGVLLTNGWDRHARARAVALFGLEPRETERRHQAIVARYEEGELNLEEYLDRVVFYEKRPFGRDRFRDFMFEQSRPYPDMLSLAAQLKAQPGLRVAVLSNEGRELTEFRIREFNLAGLADVFVSSCFVHLRKPDPAIYRLALDLMQTSPAQALYIEDTEKSLKVAGSMGIQGILHTGYTSTRERLASLGLWAPRGSRNEAA